MNEPREESVRAGGNAQSQAQSPAKSSESQADDEDSIDDKYFMSAW